MKNYLFLKHLIARLKKYIFIFLLIATFLFIHETKSFSEENVFIIDSVIVEGKIDINFSREKYINQALTDSFEILKYRILLSKDLQKISNIKLKDVKTLINRFQILEETFKKEKYTGTYKIFYDDGKVKKFLSKKNISFAEPSKISAVFYPALFIDGEMKDFNGNYFYKKWNSIKIKNEVINFIMPLEDIDDISKIKEMKNTIEELNINDLVNKYDVQNYVFALMDYNNNKLNVYLKTMFNNNKTSRHITYEIDNIDNQSSTDFILKDLKLKITDIWKEENIINLSMPLTINVKFEYKKLIDLDKLKDTFYQINIIDNYSLEELNINNSFFKIYYYGNPKRLSTELLKHGYKLKNDQGHWILHTH